MILKMTILALTMLSAQERNKNVLGLALSAEEVRQITLPVF